MPGEIFPGLAPFIGDNLGAVGFSPALAVYADEVIAQARKAQAEAAENGDRFVVYRPQLTAVASIEGEQDWIERIKYALANQDFYILCPDNETPRELDEKRIQWNTGDVIANRPALSRWHPDFAGAYEEYIDS